MLRQEDSFLLGIADVGLFLFYTQMSWLLVARIDLSFR
jgi:hypothetical protein